jgi:hypothetical protein
MEAQRFAADFDGAVPSRASELPVTSAAVDLVGFEGSAMGRRKNLSTCENLR